jgi:hypothetical protein
MCDTVQTAPSDVDTLFFRCWLAREAGISDGEIRQERRADQARVAFLIN